MKKKHTGVPTHHKVLIFSVYLAFFLTGNYHISPVIRQSFSFQNNQKNLDPSYKLDLDLWDCLGGVKLVYSKIS